MVETETLEEIDLLVRSEMLARRLLTAAEIVYNKNACVADVVWTLRDSDKLYAKHSLALMHVDRFLLGMKHEDTYAQLWSVWAMKFNLKRALASNRDKERKRSRAPAPRYDDVFFRGVEWLDKNG